jgi:hypothetical protein
VTTGEIRRNQLQLAGAGTAFHVTRYSHQHESEQNPARVWCLSPQPSAAPFKRVIASVSAA